MMEILSRISATDCVKLCHRVVDGLCGREPPCRSDYSTTWSLEEWLQLLDFLTSLFRLAVGNDIPDEEVSGAGGASVFCPSAQVVTSCPAGSVQVLAKLSDADHSHADAVLSVLRGRWEEIRRALLDRTSSISSATLQDFDWQLKLALSSDKISSLNTPLLSLCLDVRENGALRPITMELNREEVSTLISSLEAANKVVLQLK
ncbi:COMM domain-containing protein 8 isoform X1 [Xiphophorus couchianus]|uniref:COMM domain-containing protein 8 isoform X1 n=1 Tax=Xiphophorus couchianus TaxID=32473 RepID=UPI001016D12B|nr:COMM domain-containing protein 8 isoform X1 [Xiphophorus couchianus]